MNYLVHHELAELAITQSDDLFLPKVGSINSDVKMYAPGPESVSPGHVPWWALV